ncbi:coiled-coil domain-containing protein [Stakelama tenebrarum]|uniref:Uncharacterized protein n=1 Tax=Stakelama tenebrarum TaxID=2711215 RepID=A0A6G6Y3F9_9SPHN|nr:hypothetical protein [Sphingosinithalassobacter tenebrarum]QIG79455.1 hypothetical protein G5C33_06415 [Sphingosinithalassobacter tenebrarum]
MALSQSDIEELKAAVPPHMRPAAGAGALLPASFGLASAHDYDNGPPEQQNTVPAFVGPLSGPDTQKLIVETVRQFDAGQIDTTSLIIPANLGKLRATAEKRKRDQRSADLLLLDLLDRRLAELDAELAAIDGRLSEITRRRNEIGESMEALDELARLQARGEVDPNNRVHAALLRKAGISPDEAQGDGLSAAIVRRRHQLGGEDDALAAEWNEKMKRRGEVMRERQDVITARAEIENADTDEARIAAETRATTLIGAQQLGEAAYQSDNESAREIAADAVAATEEEARRVESQQLNRDTATRADEFYKGGNDLDWIRGPSL